MLDKLIDKQDSFELTRDLIAQTLADEFVNQQALATGAGKDPELWKADVFTERSHPWERYLKDTPDETPIVHVWFDSESFDKSASNIMERQKATGVYNIDCYGYGKSAKLATKGHTAGDKEAAIVSHRIARLVRNILMADVNTRLQTPALVIERWINSVNTFQPSQGNRQMENILATRIVLNVTFNEFAPQADITDLIETIGIDIKRAEDGAILAQLEL